MTSRVFQSRHVLCSNQSVSCIPIKTSPRFQGRHALVLKEHMWWNFGRTDLRISQSRAKFDAGADGDVRFAVRRPKPRKICKTKFFRPENFAKKIFSAEQ